MDAQPLVIDAEEFSDRINAAGRQATADDQCRTWDGRLLNSKAAILGFLEEVEIARREGRTLEP